MDKKCESCGKEYVSDESWLECPDCGKTFCQHCSDKMMKEHRDIEKLREGDSYTRVQILCPSCATEMYR